MWFDDWKSNGVAHWELHQLFQFIWISIVGWIYDILGLGQRVGLGLKHSGPGGCYIQVYNNVLIIMSTRQVDWYTYRGTTTLKDLPQGWCGKSLIQLKIHIYKCSI